MARRLASAALTVAVAGLWLTRPTGAQECCGLEPAAGYPVTAVAERASGTLAAEPYLGGDPRRAPRGVVQGFARGRE